MPLFGGLESDIERLIADIRNSDAESLMARSQEGRPAMQRGPIAASPAPLAAGPPIPAPGIEWAEGAYRATTVSDVQRLVRLARDNGRRLRVAGSSHSTTAAVYTPDARDLRVVLRGQLQQVEFVSADANSAVVRVGAGCYLGINPADQESTAATSLNHLLDGRGFALPTLGGISHQSVAGFLETSSSGGSLRHGIADAVIGIQLVDGVGNVHEYDLGDDGLNASAVSMGLAGVITRVTFRVEQTYYVEGVEANFKVADSILQKNAAGEYPITDALSTNEYMRLNWFPQKFVKRVNQWTGRRTAPDPNRKIPYHNVLQNELLNVIAAAVLEITGGVLALDPNGEVAQRIIGALLCKFVDVPSSREFRDDWYNALPSDDQAKVDTLIKVIFTELWLPTNQLGTALDRLNTMFDNNGAAAGNFVVELYGARQSPFWLSPSFGRDVARIDVFWWAHNIGDPLTYFGRYWDILLDLPGLRFHWGKQMPQPGSLHAGVRFDPDFLRRAYPKFDDWLAFRAQMDPNRIFVTDYWAGIVGL